MSAMSRVRRNVLALVAMAGLVVVSSAPAMAQDAPNEGNVSVSVGIDATNAYLFRGIYQDDTKLITWPYAEMGLELFSGDGGLQSVGITLGTWNSLHPGDAGSDGPSGKLWYESDFYAGFGLGFAGGVSLDTTFTAYTSPNTAFDTVKEISFQLGVDDSAWLGAGALQPYALIAFELDGQADGGFNEGTYLELGVAPGIEGSRAGLSFPIKVGLSLKDYYELYDVDTDTTADNTFGFFSVGAIVSVPLSGIPARFGSWNIQGGVEFQRLGTTTKAFNDGDASRVIGLFGVALSY